MRRFIFFLYFFYIFLYFLYLAAEVSTFCSSGDSARPPSWPPRGRGQKSSNFDPGDLPEQMFLYFLVNVRGVLYFFYILMQRRLVWRNLAWKCVEALDEPALHQNLKKYKTPLTFIQKYENICSGRSPGSKFDDFWPQPLGGQLGGRAESPDEQRLGDLVFYSTSIRNQPKPVLVEDWAGRIHFLFKLN